MRAGDNASVPAHAGPLNSRERLATHGSASSSNMMVASDIPNGVPKHRPGPGYPVNRSFNAEKCRHEGCTAMLQGGSFCRQHAQLSAAEPHGIRKPSMTRNVPIVPSQPRSASFNGVHSFQRQDAQPRTDSSPSNGKKVLPEKLVARKSSSTTPSMPTPTRTEASSLYANNTSQPNDTRPQKRQRVSGSYEVPDLSYSGRPRFSSELQGYFDDGRPRSSQGSPLQSNLNIAPSRPQPAVHHHPNGLHSPVTTGASPAASPAWGSPLLQSRTLQHGPRASPPRAHQTLSARPPTGHSGLSNGAKLPPNQRAMDQRGMDRAQQPPISREYLLGSNGVPSPDIPQDYSGAALALYEKHRREKMSHAELKARMQDAKLCPNPPNLAPEVVMRSSDSQNSGTRDRATPNTVTHSRHEQQPLRAAPARPSNWRPPVPSMSSFHAWPHGPAAIDLTRSSTSPTEISGSRPQSSGNTQPLLSQVKVFTVTSAPSPKTSIARVDPEVLPGKDTAVAALQESVASPKSALITDEPPKAPTDSTRSLSRPTSRHNRTPPKQETTACSQSLPEKVKVGESFHQAERASDNTTTESTIPLFRHKSDEDRKQRIHRQLEAAKRAEDALRRGVALMPSDPDASIKASDHIDHLHKDKVNGLLPNSTTSSDSGIALLSPATAEIFRLKEVPEPERRRLELVGKHDSAKLDGFIYGELNEPCRPMSRLFGILPKERPAPKTRPARHFAYIDPRVHWAKPRSSQWHDDMRTKMQTRGNKKRMFGKAAARQTQRKQRLQMEPPERVAADPKWLAALKVLDGMAAKHHADEKAKVVNEVVGKTSTQLSEPIKETDIAVMNGDAASNRRSVRHNYRQTNGVKSADTTPRRVLRTKNSSRQLHATVEDADESEDEDDEHSAYGASGGRKTDVDRMEIDTTPTRKRR